MTKIHLHAAGPGALFSSGGGVDVTISGYTPGSDEQLRDTIGAATVALVTILGADPDSEPTTEEDES